MTAYRLTLPVAGTATRGSDMGWLKYRICMILGHRLRVVGHAGFGGRKLKYTRYKRFYAIHDPTKTFVPWDFELEDEFGRAK